jgi:protein AroM
MTAIGIVTVGQAPRSDVVPEMAALLGPGVYVMERGALDGLSRPEIERLAPGPGDEILVTRLVDGSPVFVAKKRVVPLVQARLTDLDAQGSRLNVVLCTGSFPPLVSAAPLVEPEKVLLGMLRAIRYAGRLGVVTPSVPHVPQTEARWRAQGFDAVVAPLSPYEEEEPGAMARAAAALREGGAGLVVLDCMGFREPARARLRALCGTPVVVANRLVARVAAELLP